MPPERLKRIAVLALPIIGGMVSQNIFNLVDTAMVGTLGNSALAAVGLGGFAAFNAAALLLGISTGVQAMAARRKGEGNLERAAAPLNAGLVVVFCVGIVLAGGLYFLVPTIYPLLNADPEVIRLGVPYLQIRVLAIVFLGMNYAFRGFWNAVDLSRLYMTTLVLMHVLNVTLNYALIFGHFGAPAMGVTGAGLASAISFGAGTAFYFVLGFRHGRPFGFLRVWGDARDLMTLVRVSLPSGLQQFFFSAGFTTLYWIIGRVGTVELAAANVVINLMLVAILPGIGLGMASATLVGQALGRRDPADAARWAWDVVKLGVVAMALLGTPMWAATEPILSLFIHDPHTLAVAAPPIRLVGFFMAIEAVGVVLMGSLQGAGDAHRVMIVSVVLQWLIFLPTAYLIGPVLGFGLLGIWIAQSIYRACQALVFAAMWRRGAWAEIKV